YGAIIKAGAHDSEMVRALGINLPRLRLYVFALGVALAAIAGVVMAPIWGVRPHVGVDAVVPAFLIIVLGGVGSLWGAVIAGLMVGMVVGLTGAYASELRDAGLDAHGLAMDAHSVAEIQTAIDATAQRFGALDLLVNCVGIQREQKLDELNEETFDEIVTVNLKAAVFMAQAAARHQAAAVEAGRSPGRQVHLLSVRAQLGMRDRGYT